MIAISFSPNVGGLETYLDDLCSYLTKRGHKVCVISYQPITTRARGKFVEKIGGVEIYRVPWFGRNLFPRLERYPILEFVYLTPMLLVSSLLFMLRHHREIDVVHVHGLNAAFVAKALSKIFGKESFVSIHAIYNLVDRIAFARLVKWVLSSFDMILLPSEMSRQDLLAAGVSADRLKVCPQWVSLDVFKPLDKERCKRELGLRGKFSVLFVGRLIEKKGFRLLLNTASHMTLDDMAFIFVGDGPLSGEIKAKASAWSNVIFAGKVTEDVLVKYYSAADIVVVPSLYDEVFGRTIIESISCGTPVVASNRGAIPEVLNPSVGRLINLKTHILTEEIMHLYKNPNELYKLAENCRRYAEAHYSDKNALEVEKCFQTFYKQILNSEIIENRSRHE